MKHYKQEQRLEIQKSWCVSLVLQILLLFVGRIFWEVYDPPFDWPIIVWAFFQIFVLLIVFFLVFKLPYLHLVIQLGFVIFAVYMLVKEKNIERFLLTLFLTAIAVALDISWIQVKLVW
ncbi:MAG: hypothetical protein J1E01_02775 [Acetatifactor sp.]|nr:hypothetical protein [Acetatifactor sp.]